MNASDKMTHYVHIISVVLLPFNHARTYNWYITKIALFMLEAKVKFSHDFAHKAHKPIYVRSFDSFLHFFRSIGQGTLESSIVMVFTNKSFLV